MGSVGTSKGGFLTKEQQLNIVLETNPAENDISTWIRELSDILTFQEAIDDYGLAEGGDYTEDFTENDIQNALKSGKITVYSSKPIVNGDWVTPSAMEAASYSGNNTIYKANLDVKDVAWVDAGQGQLATKNKIKYSSMSSKGMI